LGVKGLSFDFLGVGFGLWGLGFRVGVLGFWFEVYDLGFRVRAAAPFRVLRFQGFLQAMTLNPEP
jgi:hypothetical protein